VAVRLRVPHPLWILTTAVVLGVVAVGLEVAVPIYDHHRAVLELQAHGQVHTLKGGPNWLRTRLGDERMKPFDRVSQIFAHAEFGDDDAQHLAHLPELEYAYLCESQITDAGMADIGRVTHLQALLLDRTSVSDDGIRLLIGLSNLRFLSVGETQATGAGVAELQRALPKLTIER
jgi:hypothetical protein